MHPNRNTGGKQYIEQNLGELKDYKSDINLIYLRFNDNELSRKYEESKLRVDLSYMKYVQPIYATLTLITLLSSGLNDQLLLVLIRFLQVVLRYSSFFIVRKFHCLKDIFFLLDAVLMIYINLELFGRVLGNETNSNEMVKSMFLSSVIVAFQLMTNQILVVSSWIHKSLVVLGIYALLQWLALDKFQNPKFKIYIQFYIFSSLIYIFSVYFYERNRMIEFLRNWKSHQELTNLKQELINKLESENELKNLVMASVSHDLRTPIFNIQDQIAILADQLLLNNSVGKQSPVKKYSSSLPSQLLQQSHSLSQYQSESLWIESSKTPQFLTVNNSVNEPVDAIKRNCKRMLYQIQDILDYTKCQKFDRIRVKPKYFKLTELIQDLNSIFQIPCKKKKLELMILNRVPEDEFVFSDYTRLMQILINLVGNSIKFTLKGSIRVEIEMLPSEKHPKNGLISFKITDTGIGMTQDQLNSIFKFFVSFDSKSGNGLGLAISQLMVQSLGPSDKVHVSSTEGKGSTFRFEIYKNYELSLEDQSKEKSFGFFSNREIEIDQKQIGQIRKMSHKTMVKVTEDAGNQVFPFIKGFSELSEAFSKDELPSEETIVIYFADDESFNHECFARIIKKYQRQNRSKRIKVHYFYHWNEIDQFLKDLQLEKTHLTNPLPDLMVLDYQIPGKNGLEICEEIMKLSQLYNLTLPYLTISSADQYLQFENHPNIEIIPKPLNLSKINLLLEKIKTY